MHSISCRGCAREISSYGGGTRTGRRSEGSHQQSKQTFGGSKNSRYLLFCCFQQIYGEASGSDKTKSLSRVRAGHNPLLKSSHQIQASPTNNTMSAKNSTPSDRRRGSRANLSAKKPKYKPSVKTPPPRATAESQEILDHFRNAFSTLFTPHLPSILQTVKAHLFKRDFLRAFGTQENLEAYAVRWSPSRALAYREVFLEICQEVRDLFDLNIKRAKPVEVVCIGGGAGAEVIAIAAVVRSLLQNDTLKDKKEKASDDPTDSPSDAGEELKETVSSLEITSPPTADTATSEPTPNFQSLHLTAIDIADWAPIVTTLSTTLTTPPSPRYPAFISPSTFSVTFHHHDILIPPTTPLIPLSTSLITLLFTTNELYTQSRVATTEFLLSLKEQTLAGCLLLVLESAGSYSTIQVNGKTFPMGMLLDHTLLAGDVWEKLVGEEAKWYRLPEGLRYPIELENMRYFVRVYRRV